MRKRKDYGMLTQMVHIATSVCIGDTTSSLDEADTQNVGLKRFYWCQMKNKLGYAFRLKLEAIIKPTCMCTRWLWSQLTENILLCNRKWLWVFVPFNGFRATWFVHWRWRSWFRTVSINWLRNGDIHNVFNVRLTNGLNYFLTPCI